MVNGIMMSAVSAYQNAKDRSTPPSGGRTKPIFTRSWQCFKTLPFYVEENIKVLLFITDLY